MKTENKKNESQNTENKKTVHREYKSRLFAMIFSEKEELLELYNAVNGSHYTDPELLEINTLENAIYMSMKNDLSFVIDMRLNLYEHQSTYNPNMPLRNLFYVSDLLSKITKNQNVYGRKTIQIPTPHFIVFYNGVEKRPESEQMRLSDLYTIKEDEKQLELIVTVLNINSGYNRNLMENCKTLKDYCLYNQRIRDYLNQEQLPLDQVVEKVITECIQENILSEFLSKNRWEAMKMSIYEFDQEQHDRFTKQEGYEEGIEKGIEKGIERGREEGQAEILVLVNKLLAENRQEDVTRITSDKEYRTHLLREYQIV